MIPPTMKLTLDTAPLAMDARTVSGIRLSQLGMGRGTAGETQLMVTEKMLALVEAAATVATGGSAHTMVSAIRKRVRANVKRLRR